MLNVAILISGRGSNMHALLRATHGEDANCPITLAKIVLVISNNPDAKGLDTARQYGVKTEILPHKLFPTRAAYDHQLTDILKSNQIDFICLAGFMRILSAEFCHEWRGKLINIHPSLLPDYKGLDTHRRVIEAGEKQHGCTVHFVTPGMDEGPTILQEKVPVLPGDTPDTLAERVLQAEHRCYPRALWLYSQGKIDWHSDNRVIVENIGESKMAKNNHSNSNPYYAENKATYDCFLKLSTYGTVAVIALLVGMAIFLV